MQAIRDGERVLVELLREIAADLGLAVASHFEDWLLRLSKPGGSHPELIVVGYDLGLNASSSAEACRDKAATAALLGDAGVAHVEHRIIFRPDWSKYVDQGSVYEVAVRALHDFGDDVVCKNNKGTGGTHVYRARTMGEMEYALQRIFAIHHACTLSPFLEIAREVRVILVDGVATALFEKRRPEVVGDGASTLALLVARDHPEILANGSGFFSEDDLRSIPARGEVRPLGWKHNLGLGARPDFSLEKAVRDGALDLGRRAMEALRLRAASVDVVWSEDGLPCVLEINSGLMVEGLARSGAEGRGMAKETYLAVIRAKLAGH